MRKGKFVLGRTTHTSAKTTNGKERAGTSQIAPDGTVLNMRKGKFVLGRTTHTSAKTKNGKENVPGVMIWIIDVQPRMGICIRMNAPTTRTKKIMFVYGRTPPSPIALGSQMKREIFLTVAAAFHHIRHRSGASSTARTVCVVRIEFVIKSINFYFYE
jgi:hypothetical protein